jgi:hypothetical protein
MKKIQIWNNRQLIRKELFEQRIEKKMDEVPKKCSTLGLCLEPPPPLYLIISLSIVLCCVHLPVATSSSSLSNYLSIYCSMLYTSICTYLLLLLRPPLYLCYFLSIYCWSKLFTSICSYFLLLLSIYLLSLYLLFYVVYFYLYLPPPPLYQLLYAVYIYLYLPPSI